MTNNSTEIEPQEEPIIRHFKWIAICKESDLVVNSGICALAPTQTPKQQQLAIFTQQISRQNSQTYVVSNWDPIGKANVISRGIIGSIDEQIVVSSPLYKQHFSLVNGHCIEDSLHRLEAYESRIENGVLLVKLPTE